MYDTIHFLGRLLQIFVELFLLMFHPTMLPDLMQLFYISNVCANVIIICILYRLFRKVL